MEFIWILLGLALGLVLPRIFRALFESEPPPEASSTRGGREERGVGAPSAECIRCGHLLFLGSTRCKNCGLVSTSPMAKELADLKATARQLVRFEAKNVLGPKSLAALLKKVEARRRRLSGEKRAPAAPVGPVRPSVPPRLVESDQAEILTVIPAEPELSPRIEDRESRIEEAGVFPEVTPRIEDRGSKIEGPGALPPSSILHPRSSTPKVPRRSFREVLAAFMEQRNIFWGELAAGLLIVGGSVALVISLWTSGALEKPFSQFLIFALINAVLFGAGWYTLRYWKLESTSRGLLAIATLLVPLSFLVMGRLPGIGKSDWNILEILVEIVSVAAFVGLVELAARVLVPGQRWWLTAAVVGASASQLLFSWASSQFHPEMNLLWLLALGAVPVACQVVGNSVALFKATRAPSLELAEAKNLFTFLGISSFALTVAFSFLIHLSGVIPGAPQHLALLVALSALPVLICGIVVHRGLADALEAGTLRTSATAIALLGMLLLLAAAFQAWPNPTLFLMVCAVDFAVLTVVAFRYDLPIAHAAALPCLALAYLVLFHLGHQILFEAQISEGPLSFDLFTSAKSGTGLVGLFLMLGIASELIVRGGKPLHAAYYALGGGAIALWSLLLVTLPIRGIGGIEHPLPAMAVYAIYGICGLLVNARWRRPIITSVALALLAGATLWALRWRHLDLNLSRLDDAPLWGAVLALQSLLLGLLAAGLGWTRKAVDQGDTVVSGWREAYREPLARSGEAVALLAILTALAAGLASVADWASRSWALEHVATSGCLMAVFLLLAIVERRVAMARMAGLMLIGGVVAGTGWAQTITADLELAQQLPAIALWISVAGCFMAGVAIWAGRDLLRLATSGTSDASTSPERWYRILFAWRETAVVAVALSLLIALAGLRNTDSILPSYTSLFLAATAFLLVWGFQSVSLTWVGSFFVLCSLAYALIRRYPRTEMLTPSSLAFLYHATIALVASLFLKNLARFVPSSLSPADSPIERSSLPRIHRLFAEPLGQVALASSCLALPILIVVPAGTTFSCLGLFWLAALWLVVSIGKRSPVLITACQAVLVMAVLFGTTAWLEAHTWFMDYPGQQLARYFDPRSLQAYGLGLGAFCLVWMAARIALQSGVRIQGSGVSGQEPAVTGKILPDSWHLIPDSWFAVDRLVLAGLVLGQAALAVLGVLPGAIDELLEIGAADHARIWAAEVVPFAYASGAWMLLALIAIVLITGLWEKQAASSVVGLTIAAATIPVLAAGDYAEQSATASALRWWLALAFLECSVLVWARGPLCRLAVKIGCKVEPGTSLPGIVRQLLFGLTAAPALVLTGMVAYLGFVGSMREGPESGSFFHWIGWTASNVVPPAVISLVLAGYALRERSPVYAFASGLIADLTIMGGYALGVVIDKGSLGPVDWVRVFQLGTITAAVWAIGWLWMRSRLFGERKEPESSLAQPLLTAQIALGATGNAFLIAGVLWLLAIFYPSKAVDAIKEVGSPLGWLALVSATGAWGLRQYQRRALPLREAGFVGLAALVLLACGIEGFSPGWGYRALMLGWAVYPLVWVLGAWWAMTKIEDGGPRIEARSDRLQAVSERPAKAGPYEPWARSSILDPRSSILPFSLSDATAYWVRLAGALAVLLAFKAAFLHRDQDQLWAAVAVALVCPAAAVLAVWRRQEAWAFAAALGVNLAASLAVWHFHVTIPLADWWVYLLQANVIASSAGAILWLSMRRQIYGLGEPGASATGERAPDFKIQGTPLLPLQVTLTLAGNAVLWAVPLVLLALAPENPSPLLRFGQIWGWLAWLAAGAGSLWYVRQVSARNVIHVLAGFGLGLGVLAACGASRWDASGNWLTYHVLTVAWILIALAFLLAGWHAFAALEAKFQEPNSKNQTRWYLGIWFLEFGSWNLVALISWLEAFGILILALAIGGARVDPGRPYWSAGATLAVSAMSGALALWLRRPFHVYTSGLLINVAGTIIWVAAGDQSWERLVYLNVFSFALGSALWSTLELWLRGRTSPVNLRDSGLPFSHLAVMSGLLLICVTIALAHLAPGIGIPALETGGFAWSVLMAIILAIIICLWDPAAELVCAWLYLAGLAAILLALQNAQLTARELLWNFAVSVAPYLLLAAAISWVSPRLQNWWRAIRLPRRPEGWPQPWLVPAQLFFGIQIVALSLWMALDFDGLFHRLAGPLAAALLVPAGILMAGTQWIRSEQGWQTNGGRRGLLEYCTLALGALTAVELGWAWLDPSAHDFSWLWLHRNVMAMMALASMTVVYGVGLSRWSPAESPWAQCGRRIGPILGVLATAVLAVILGQEAWLASGEAVPMAPEAIAVVALAMAGLATAGLCFAVLPGQDPLGLSERGRTIYVYAAELILVLIFVHLKLTIPWLFKQRIFLHYWPFILMAIAFLGVGLSEYFRRRQLRVLAEPLERTGVFLPLLPVLAYWTLREPNQYAIIWFLAGLVYGLVSIFKRSWSFALFGALAANVGLWVLLQEHEVHFLKHPQFWLIPIALIGLAAEQLNRDRLTPNQSTALRYLCLIVVYVSSTADMFIAGLGNSWEMPLLLTVLSLLGMLAGMALRIRAFLYLGSSFLLLVVLTMIWHAGADLGQKWIWFASVVVLGLAMLALFGLFEKRRNDVLRVVDELRKWH